MIKTKIEWTDHTFSPWLGCDKVSAGCKNCYIVTTPVFRFRGIKHGQPRIRTQQSTWAQAVAWNEQARKSGKRVMVFPSLCDWLDDQAPIEWLADFLDLVRTTPHLTWQLLTKRPENWSKRLHEALANNRTLSLEWECWVSQWLDGDAPQNVWYGVSVEDQAAWDARSEILVSTPAAVRFLSCEPLLGPVIFSIGRVMAGFPKHIDGAGNALGAPLNIHWVICGGESGKNARPMHPDWARSLRDQCAKAGVPFLFKQHGEWLPAKLLPEKRFQLEFHKDATGPARPEFHYWPDGNISARVGKKAAGRRLDGIEHNGFPEGAARA